MAMSDIAGASLFLFAFGVLCALIATGVSGYWRWLWIALAAINAVPFLIRAWVTVLFT
jgi:hypothetical protein